MVRVCCACGAQEKALNLVAEAQAKGVKPRLRTLSAVLLQASEAGDRSTCESLWARLPSLGLEPQDSEFAIMLRTFRGEPLRDSLRVVVQPVASKRLPPA
ncbi:hcea [Symbiodinium pilosum]|uniref:Hcea protein n=1 Tax=Symbiodinium pilosum TaxID=2952 RepID=A0A812M719_SYMPI|nr:hcea [Symbiodinium pilosum]